MFVCLSPPASLERSSPNLVGGCTLTPEALEEFIFLKVKVIGVEGQMFVSRRFLGRLGWNLVGGCTLTQELPFRGTFFWRSRSLGSKVKYLFLRGSWADWDETWWVGNCWPENCPWWVHFLKVKVIGGQRSNVCFSEVLGPIGIKLDGWMYPDPRIALERYIFLKVKVVGVEGQMFVSQRFLGRLGWNLVDGCTLTEELPLRGTFFWRSRSLGSKVKCLFLRGSWADWDETWSMDVPWPKNCPWEVHFFEGQGRWGWRSNVCFSEVLGPIGMKLGELVNADLRIALDGFIFLKVKVVWVKGQTFVSRRFLGWLGWNLVSWLLLTWELPLIGSYFEGQGHWGQRSNVCFSEVLGLNGLKLGELIAAHLRIAIAFKGASNLNPSKLWYCTITCEHQICTRAGPYLQSLRLRYI